MVFGKVNYHLHKVILNLKKNVAIKLDIQNDGLHWHFRTQILDFTITFISSRFKKKMGQFFYAESIYEISKPYLKVVTDRRTHFFYVKICKGQKLKKKMIFFYVFTK